MTSHNTNTEYLNLTPEQKLVLDYIIKTGPTNIKELSTSLKIKRTTLYLHIDGLLSEGYITKTAQGKSVLLSIATKSSLNNIINREKELFKMKRSVIEDISNHAKDAILSKDKSSIIHLTGTKGFRELLDLIIKTNKDIYWIGSFDRLLSVVGDSDFYKLMTWRRMDKKTTSYAYTDRSIKKYPKYSEDKNGFRKVTIISERIESKSLLFCFGPYFGFADLDIPANIFLIKNSQYTDLFKIVLRQISV